MTARSFATVCVRLLGLLFLLLGIALLAGQVFPLLAYMQWINWDLTAFLPSFDRAMFYGLNANHVGGSIVCTSLGWYLLFRGRRVLVWIVRGLGDECTSCGYDLTGVKGGKCPECGASVRPEAPTVSGHPATPAERSNGH